MSDFGLKKLDKTIRFLRFPSQNPATMKYLEKTKGNPDIISAVDDSPTFGFLKIRTLLQESPIDRIKYLNVKENLTDKFGWKDICSVIRTYPQFLGVAIGVIKQFLDLKANSSITEEFSSNLPSSELWEQLVNYSHKKWGIQSIGFTRVPKELIIHGRHILYPYALVLIDEMKKDRIDEAPQAKAGFETIRVYNHLGKAILDIAKWLRSNGIKCQPNHPLGGLVSYVPLAAKAGLGWQGMNGLLITPEFGQRQRIAPIYIEKPVFPFTDSTEHSWVEKYCQMCKLCQKECPPDAIQDQKTVYKSGIETIGRLSRCLDPIKCHPQFQKMQGCSICVKVCPFSQGNNIYYKIKERFV
ncbi:MAG: hypothetical protein ACTSWC_05180 [Promethearchaeota archaeon]